MKNVFSSLKSLGSLKPFFGFVALLPSALGCASVSRPVATAPPNLIVILSDDHRWDALGAAGNPAVITPVMDRMAREGVYFRQATTSVSQCHPVRASLITGLLAFQHGVYSNKFMVPGVEESLCKRPTVSGLLHEAGYRTVLVGKWHVTLRPWNCGIDEARTWLPQAGTGYRDPELVRGDSDHYEVVPGFTQEIFANDALAFLRSKEARKKPFLLWVGFTAPHLPYEPNPERIESLYAGRDDKDFLPPGFPRDVKANDWRHYDEAVSYLDEQIGRLLAALRETGLAKSTVVVLLGDNGYMMGERGIGGPDSGANGKLVPYESSLRVPFLMLGPGLPKGLASDLPVSSLDLPPTLLSLAGIPAPASWPGRDLTAALAGKIQIGEAFAEWSDEKSDSFGRFAFRAVRTPTHKLIVWKDPARGDELYDLKADPAETRNLIADPAAADLARDLRSRLLAWMKRNGDPALSWPAKP